jgi:hypothetical protein
MAAAIQLDPSRDETRGESYLPGRVAHKSGSGGGDMDDVLQRLGAVESSLSALRIEVSGITATVPHLATKADLSAMETKIIKWIIATVIATAGVAFSIAKFVH